MIARTLCAGLLVCASLAGQEVKMKQARTQSGTFVGRRGDTILLSYGDGFELGYKLSQKTRVTLATGDELKPFDVSMLRYGEQMTISQTDNVCDEIRLKRPYATTVTKSDANVNGRTMRVTEEFLGRLHGKVFMETLRTSPDNGHVSYVTDHGGKQIVVIDGLPSRAWTTVSVPVFSANSYSFAYFGRLEDGWHLVVGGKESSQPWKGFLRGGLALGPQGKRVASIVWDGKNAMLLLDGKPGVPFDGAAPTFVFSPDGSHVVAYMVRGKTWFRVMDDSPVEIAGAPVAECGVFSKDGKHYADATGKGEEGKKFIVFLDGERVGQEYDGVQAHGLRFRPTDQTLGFTAQIGNDIVVIVGGRAYPTQGGSGGLRFGPNGDFVFVAGPVGKRHISLHGIDGEQKGEGPLYDDIAVDSITFSPDGKHFAYAANRGSKVLVNLDGKEGALFDDIVGWNIAFSPDSGSVAYVAKSAGREFVVHDGRQLPAYDDVGPPLFCTESNTLAWAAADSKNHVLVVDGLPVLLLPTRNREGFRHLNLATTAPATVQCVVARNGSLFRVQVCAEPQ